MARCFAARRALRSEAVRRKRDTGGEDEEELDDEGEYNEAGDDEDEDVDRWNGEEAAVAAASCDSMGELNM